MAELTLRHAEPSDLDLLEQLELACFTAQPWGRGELAGCFEDERYLVLLLFSGTEPIGYLIGWHVLDEAELARIGVLPQHRRGGLGRGLLEAGIAEWRRRGVASLFLDVRSTNSPAIALYENAAFERVGLRRAYYSDDDAVLMRLDLTPIP